MTDDEKAKYAIQALIIMAFEDEPSYLKDIAEKSRWFEEGATELDSTPPTQVDSRA